MRLFDLQLDDFGCFRNAQMRDIDDGLVVVGGPQRAGKTTFMQVVRQLGWGIKRDDSLPPPADEYRLYAQFANDDERHMLNLDGYATPEATPLDGSPKRSIEEIFGSISRLQYEQLFTISLAELQRLPPGIEDSADLSEVLLGGAYGDIADVPAMESDFADRAYDIGRTYGKPTKRSELRDPMDTIQDGLELRKQAKAQVDEHREKSNELAALEETIGKLEAERDALAQEQQRLSVVATEFDDIRRYQELRRSLDEADVEESRAFPANGLERASRLNDDYSDVCARLQEATEVFTSVTDATDVDQQRRAVLDRQNRIEQAHENISGWKERLNQIEDAREDVKSTRASIENRIAALHPDCEGARAEVKQVDTDLVRSTQVADAVSAFETATERVETTNATLENKRDQLEAAEETVAELESEDSSRETRSVVRNFAVVAASAILGGGGLSIAGYPYVGLGVSLVLFVIGLVSASRKLTAATTGDSPLQHAKGHVNSLETEVAGLERELAEHEETRDDAAAELADIRETLGFPADVSPAGVESFYDEVVALSSELTGLEQDETGLADKQAALADELRDVAKTVSSVESFDWNDDDRLDTAQSLFAAIRSASEAAGRAERLDAVQVERRSLEADIRSLLDEWDGIDLLDADDPQTETVTARLQAFIDAGEQATAVLEDVDEKETRQTRLRNRFETQAITDAFAPIREEDDETWLDALERVADAYVDQEAVEAQRELVDAERDAIIDTLETKQKERIDLQRELSRLASDDDLIDARETITEGQQELQRLGEAYAVNRIAEALTETLHERFIEEVAGSLIEEAGEVFQRITTEYTGITHTEELDDLRFKALRNGKPPHASQELSRATAEQLFLAIRIARIRQLDVTLPLVLDDSMANFDPDHGARMLQTVDELSKTHQVFLLTCHPEQVALAAEHAQVSQYWCLDNGRFEGPHEHADIVLELLTGDGVFEDLGGTIRQ